MECDKLSNLMRDVFNSTLPNVEKIRFMFSVMNNVHSRNMTDIQKGIILSEVYTYIIKLAS